MKSPHGLFFPYAVLLEGRVELHLLLWACPSQPGDVATCADVTLPSGSASPTPTTAQGSTATASPVSSPGGGKVFMARLISRKVNTFKNCETYERSCSFLAL